MRFSANALISTPNPKYGGECFYAFRANKEEGVVDRDLDKKEFVKRDKKINIF